MARLDLWMQAFVIVSVTVTAANLLALFVEGYARRLAPMAGVTGLVAAGAMGLAWVLLITALVAAEKLLPGGEWIARVAGGALVLLGVTVALRPDLVTVRRGGLAT